MKIAFFGLYDFGTTALAEFIRRKVNVACVVTKPSTPTNLQPVALAAREYGLPLLEPGSIRTPEFLDQMRRFLPDLIAVCGFHRYFPAALIDIPRWGVINSHMSLLPKYRGPSPYKWAIVHGETVTGATIVQMSQEVDSGDILAQTSCPIDEDDTGETLFQKLCLPGSRLTADVADAIQSGTTVAIPQDAFQASYQNAPTDGDACIQWNRPAAQIRNLIRGFHPRPGAWTTYDGMSLTICRASLTDMHSHLLPGSIVDVQGATLRIATNDGVLAVHDIVPKADPVGRLPHFEPGKWLA